MDYIFEKMNFRLVNVNFSTLYAVVLFSLVSYIKSQAQGEPQPPIILVDKDIPEWRLEAHKYYGSHSNKAICSDYYACKRDKVIREVFRHHHSNIMEAYAVPIYWSGFTSILSKVMQHSSIMTYINIGIWPEIILPFLFSLMGIIIVILSIIPLLIIGAVGFILLFNVRHFGAKKIRMMIRSALIKMEKFRRWKYEMSFPRQHLRKFQERDRYEMPHAFQNSDLSSDEEPQELRQVPIPRKITTLWTPDDIEIIGFDPDNLPVETIYGDLIGQPENLDPMISRFLKNRHSTDWRDELGRGSLSSDEWAEELKQQVASKNKSPFFSLRFGIGDRGQKKKDEQNAKQGNLPKRKTISKSKLKSRWFSRSKRSPRRKAVPRRKPARSPKQTPSPKTQFKPRTPPKTKRGIINQRMLPTPQTTKPIAKPLPKTPASTPPKPLPKTPAPTPPKPLPKTPAPTPPKPLLKTSGPTPPKPLLKTSGPTPPKPAATVTPTRSVTSQQQSSPAGAF